MRSTYLAGSLLVLLCTSCIPLFPAPVMAATTPQISLPDTWNARILTANQSFPIQIQDPIAVSLDISLNTT